VSALILDAGALVAVDRDDRVMMARLRASQRHGLELRTNAMVVAQAWRDSHGRQVNLARLLQATDVRAVSQRDGRAAGELQAAARTADAVDATVVLLAARGDRILTSDPGDIARLAAAAGNGAVVIAC
jgi:hypothetical protein